MRTRWLEGAIAVGPATSKVSYIQQVFASANRLKLAIAVHVATRDPAAARANADVFLNQILPRAADVVVQIAPDWLRTGLER